MFLLILLIFSLASTGFSKPMLESYEDFGVERVTVNRNERTEDLPPLMEGCVQMLTDSRVESEKAIAKKDEHIAKLEKTIAELRTKVAQLVFDSMLGGQAAKTTLKPKAKKVIKPLVEEEMNAAPATRKDENGRTAIWHAAFQGNAKLVQKLIGFEETNVNEADILGATPLHIAAQKGYMDIVKVLIEDGQADYDLELKGQEGLTPLRLAATKGKMDVVEYLVNEGATFRKLSSRQEQMIINEDADEARLVLCNGTDFCGSSGVHHLGWAEWVLAGLGITFTLLLILGFYLKYRQSYFERV